MSHPANGRFELRRLTGIEWIIVERTLPENHPNRTVACIYEVDDLEYDVVWLRDLNLRAQYASPQEVLREVVRVSEPASRSRATRPIEIPHLPPLPQMMTA